MLKTSVKCKSNGIIPQDETRQTNLALALIHIQLGGTETHTNVLHIANSALDKREIAQYGGATETT